MPDDRGQRQLKAELGMRNAERKKEERGQRYLNSELGMGNSDLKAKRMGHVAQGRGRNKPNQLNQLNKLYTSCALSLTPFPIFRIAHSNFRILISSPRMS